MSAGGLRFRSEALRAALLRMRPTRAEVDLDALASNFAAVRAAAGEGIEVLAVVKADAYGHGAVPVARALREAGASVFGVALVEEGAELREAGIAEDILLLGGISPSQAAETVRLSLTPALFTVEAVKAYACEAERAGDPARPWHLKIDTGMGRLGVPHAETLAFLEATHALRRGLRLDGVFTALATADEPGSPFTALQLRRYAETVEAVERLEGPVRLRHAANSAAAFSPLPPGTNLVRPGIALYGMSPSGRDLLPGTRPVLSLRAGIAYLKTVPSGTPLGYGGAFVTRRESRIATVPIGYDDGLARRLSEVGEMLVRGRRAPIAGRISMDLTMLDVTEVPGAGVGDEVTVIGADGGEWIAADDVARRLGTIGYEITCGIGARVPRVYLRAGEVVEIRSRFGAGASDGAPAGPGQAAGRIP